MAHTQALGARAARTRAALLEAAEQIFAERGFDGTRLEDVAARVGIRRASIVYHFKDKRELYDAVLEDVFSGLQSRIESAFSSLDPLPARVEASVTAWVDYVLTRPTFARLLLREIADGRDGLDQTVHKYTRPYFELIRKQVVERPVRASDRMEAVDPVHLASTVAGTTIFFAAAIPALVPELGLDPSAPGQVAAHREQMLRIVRRLLGIEAPTPPDGDVRRSPSSPGAKRSPRR
jgi:TetR/AcrR family transcriptional regulator